MTILTTPILGPCDRCRQPCGPEHCGPNGYWIVCDECWDKAPSRARDWLSGIDVSNDAEDVLKEFVEEGAA